MAILLMLRGGARAWGRRSVVVVVGVRVEGFAVGMRGRFQRWVMRRGGEARPRRAAVMVVKARAAVALQRSFRALKLVWILQNVVTG